MFDKFGNFDSYEEINKAAAGQKKEGDKDALMELAKENGICEEDAEGYLDGVSGELCTPMSAALGKLEIEKAELKPSGIMRDWIDYIIKLCADEYGNPDKEPVVCRGVRKKNKSLKGCIGQLLKWGHDNMQEIDAEIKKAAGFTGNVKLGMPGILEARMIIKAYYTEAK